MPSNKFQSSPSGKRLLTCVKQPIATLATTNIDLISPPATISGRVLAVEDRVLLTGQTDPDEKGIYGFNARGELEQASDWLNEEGQLVEVLYGTYAGTLYTFNNAAWTAVGKLNVVLEDGTTVSTGTLVAPPGVTSQSDGVHLFEGGQTLGAWTALNADGTTAVLPVVLALTPNAVYTCTLEVRTVFKQTAGVNVGSVDLAVDLYISVSALGVASVTPQTSPVPDASRLPAAINQAFCTVGATAGGFTIYAARHPGVASTVRTKWCCNEFERIS